ncbi:MAG: trypsin-like peptidase domain-containing protein, partial [Bacteroidales bacterium]|nr:trypsin-like peptidase domain-containing protein [Bacteroidales bacterium]
MAKGVRVFVFDQDKTNVLGAFTFRNNKEYGSLAVSPVSTDLIYIEMQAMPFVLDPGKLEIGLIAVDGKTNSSSLKKDEFFGESEYCNVDVNCYSDSTIQRQKHSVVRIVYLGEERCTGTLINNTLQNGHPYVLTAQHCLPFDFFANTAVYTFEYESPICGGTDGSTQFSISGAQIVSTTPGKLDFTLLELSEAIPFYYHPYFSGWDRTNTAPESSYTIHHPLGDVKKITIETHEALTGDFGESYDANTFWVIPNWEVGSTQKGSSGAGLINQSNRLTGVLTGGEATCDFPVFDFFEKMYHCWDDYPDPANQLESWLDPINSGAETLDGYDPYDFFWKTGDTLINFHDTASTGVVFIESFGYLSGNNVDSVKRFAEHFPSG